MKKIIAVISIFFYTLSWSIESEVVIEKSAAQQTDVTPQMINGRYVYVLQDGDTQRVMAHNGLTGSNETILILSPGDEIRKLSRVGNDLVIVKNTTGTTELWKTKGTASSTAMIPVSDGVQVANAAKQWLVHADWDQNKVYRSNGSTVKVFEILGPYDQAKCVFENGRFVVSSISHTPSVPDELNLLLVSDEGMLNLTSEFPSRGGHRIILAGAIKTIYDQCFVGYVDDNSEEQTALIDPSGVVQRMSSWPELDGVYGNYRNPLDGSHYVIQNTESDNEPIIKISKIDWASKTILASYQRPSEAFMASNMQFFGSHLVVTYDTPSASPNVSLVEFLDGQLRWIEAPFDAGPSANLNDPKAANWMEFGLVVHSNLLGEDADDSTTIWKRGDDQWIEILKLPDFTEKFMTFSESSPQGFIEGRDESDGLYKTIRVFQAPDISKNTAGAWFSADHLRQGININHGTRGDGSEYLFITVYTFDNGAPLWMAGVAELADDLSSVTIPVYQYQGLNWWQTGVEPTEGPSGTLTISHSSCDQLSVSMTLGGDSQTIDMERMVNTDSQTQCQD